MSDAIDRPEVVPVPQVGPDDVTRDLELELENEVKKLVRFERRAGARDSRSAYARAAARLRALRSLLGDIDR